MHTPPEALRRGDAHANNTHKAHNTRSRTGPEPNPPSCNPTNHHKNTPSPSPPPATTGGSTRGPQNCCTTSPRRSRGGPHRARGSPPPSRARPRRRAPPVPAPHPTPTPHQPHPLQSRQIDQRSPRARTARRRGARAPPHAAQHPPDALCESAHPRLARSLSLGARVVAPPRREQPLHDLGARPRRLALLLAHRPYACTRTPSCSRCSSARCCRSRSCRTR